MANTGVTPQSGVTREALPSDQLSQNPLLSNFICLQKPNRTLPGSHPVISYPVPALVWGASRVRGQRIRSCPARFLATVPQQRAVIWAVQGRGRLGIQAPGPEAKGKSRLRIPGFLWAVGQGSQQNSFFLLNGLVGPIEPRAGLTTRSTRGPGLSLEPGLAELGAPPGSQKGPWDSFPIGPGGFPTQGGIPLVGDSTIKFPWLWRGPRGSRGPVGPPGLWKGLD